MIEIEKRVALTIEEAEVVVADLDAKGVEWRQKERLLMDFSNDGLENRELQVMVKVDDGVPELSVKRGGVGDTRRQEASVYARNSVEDVLDAVALLGYTTASYGLRTMKTCELNGLQFSLRYIHDIQNTEQLLGVNFEIEALPGSTEADIDAAIAELGLRPMSDVDTKAFFKRLHKEANATYVHDDVSRRKIADLVQV